MKLEKAASGFSGFLASTPFFTASPPVDFLILRKRWIKAENSHNVISVYLKCE